MTTATDAEFFSPTEQQRQHVEIYAALRAAGMREHRVRFAVPDVRLEQLALVGRVRFVADRNHDRKWRGREPRDYRSEVLTDPTWLRLAVAANEMLLTTVAVGYNLEGVRFVRMEGDVGVYHFVMGRTDK
jgi:hypothetical protein